MKKNTKKSSKPATKATKPPILSTKKLPATPPRKKALSKHGLSEAAKARESKKAQERRAQELSKVEANFREAWFDMLKNIDDYKDMRIEQLAFAVFLATLPADRGTQKDFSEAWGISETTLSAWKMNPKVRKLRIETMKLAYVDQTPVVLQTLFEAATKTDFNGKYNTPAMKLWLQYVEDYREKSALDVSSEGIVVQFGGGKSPFMTADDPASQEKLKKNVDPKAIEPKHIKTVESPKPPNPKKDKRPLK